MCVNNIYYGNTCSLIQLLWGEEGYTLDNHSLSFIHYGPFKFTNLSMNAYLWMVGIKPMFSSEEMTKDLQNGSQTCVTPPEKASHCYYDFFWFQFLKRYGKPFSLTAVCIFFSLFLSCIVLYCVCLYVYVDKSSVRR